MILKFGKLGAFWARLNTRQRFIVIQLVLFAAAVFPLAIYRLSLGHLGHALFDAVLLLVFSVLVRLAVIDRFLDLALRIISVTYVVGVFGVLHLLGEIGLFWAFAAGLGAFFAVKAREALVIAAVMYLMILSKDYGGANYPTVITFTACFALVVAFGYYFSSRLWEENERLGIEARHDLLTNLLNRRSFDDDLSQLINQGSPTQGGWSMLVIDIDRFKSINDAYGHAAGDRVLKGVASILQEAVPPGMNLYRYGGEEFVVLCPGPADAARALGESLRTAVAKADLMRAGDQPVTISVGVTERRQEDDSRSVFQRADGALYEAKQKGRNQVVFA
ncbi:MAG: GGDEF domain-containing protein [Quisquiliibacterium sp.]